MPYNVLRVCVERFINDKFNYMYEFEKHPKLTEFIQEMANTGKAPQEWTSFIETLNEALRIQDVVRQSEQLACPDRADSRDEFEPDWECPDCRQKDELT